MPGDSRLSARFGASTDDFKNGVREINRELKVIESGFKATAAGMEDWSNQSEGLEARMGMLTKSIELQTQKCDAFKARQQELAKAHGENSVEAKQATIEYNNEAAKLGKLQIELKQTTSGLTTLEKQSGKSTNAFKDFGDKLSQLGTQVPALGTAIGLMSNPITIATGALAAFAAASKKSIEQTVAYNKQIREMMQLTGLSAEETSRIVQVADDWGMEIDTVRSALELMNKKGITPSIENLAQIADQYAAATDKSKFMEEATKKYGKSFGDLIPILAKGGQELRNNAESINKNMLATDESIKVSRDYEVALDNMNDGIAALGFVLGNKLLPPLTAVINALGDLIATNLSAADAANQLREMHEKGLITDQQMAEGLRDLRTGRKDAAEITTQYAEEIKKLNAIEAYNTQIEREEAIRRGHLNDITKITVITLSNASRVMTEYGLSLEEAVKQTIAGQTALEEQNKAFNDFVDALNGPIDKADEDFLKSQADVEQQMSDVQAEIQTAIDQGYSPLGEKVLDLKGKYGELQTQYQQNVIEHDKATKQIMYDLILQKMAVDGYSGAEQAFLTQLAKDWGIPYEATLAYINNEDEAIKWLQDHPGDVAGAEAILTGQKDAWQLAREEAEKAQDATQGYFDNLDTLDGKTVNTSIIETTYRVAAEPGKAPVFGSTGQHGLNMIVPSGFPNDSYPVYVESGEQVIVIPASMRQAASNLQRGIGRSASQLNVAIGGGGSSPTAMAMGAGGGSQSININLYAVPGNEMNMRRQARYIVEQIKRQAS